jgi:hypothetical protein
VISAPSIPVSTYTNADQSQTLGYSPIGPPIVSSDGSAYVEYEVRTIASPPRVTSATLYLLQIAPNNSTTTIQLSSTTNDENLFPGRILPDGQGGVLATWTINPSNPPVPASPYQAAHVVSGTVAATYGFPFAPKTVTYGKYPTLVLGENGTAFATDGSDPDNGPQVISFNLSSGSVNWSYPAPPQSTLTLISSVAGNGLTAKVSQNGIDTVINLASTGAVATDPLTGTGIGYFSGNLFTGMDSAMREYTDAPILISTSIWFQPNQRGANQANQDVTVANPSNAGANQTAIVSVYRGIKTLLAADAQSPNPSYADCRAWLGAQALPTIQLLLTGNDGHSYNFGHGTLMWTTVPPTPAAIIAAVTGLANQDGTPIGVPTTYVTTVNDGGGFFIGGAGTIGTRHYAGNTLRAQATILFHELSHALSQGNASPAGFQNDLGNVVAIRANDRLIDQHCRPAVEALDTWFWIETPWFLPGTNGTAYNSTLTARGGIAPYTWSITQGALPVGLALNAATGTISGTPTMSGTSNFTVQVIDHTVAPNTRTAIETYSITIQ